MTIGFVNAGIMSLRQAATIIFGGEIGTTISGQIVALGLFESDFVSLNTIFSSFAGLGIIISSIAKSDNGKKIGQIISGRLNLRRYADLGLVLLFMTATIVILEGIARFARRKLVR